MAVQSDSVVLPHFGNYRAVWMEITKSDHNHGGHGWDFGTCLWSPTKNARGARSYEVMTRPAVGDLVLHNYHFAPPDGRRTASYVCARSVVSSLAAVVTTEPPMAGDWVRRGDYYRIEVGQFAWLTTILPVTEFVVNYGEDLRGELVYHRPKFFPFTIANGVVRLNQGMYLTQVTQALYDLLAQAVGLEAGQVAIGDKSAVAHRQYEEGGRLRREQVAFLRNPALARDVKSRDGYACVLCQFSPLTRYGRKYQQTSLECHHLVPLAERRDPSLTNSTLNDVVTLCANCHRLVHSSQKPLTLEQARVLLEEH